MPFGDLAAEDQADARPARLRGEEGHEQVRRICEPGTLIVHGDFQAAARLLPAHVHGAAADFEIGVGGVSQQVDQ